MSTKAIRTLRKTIDHTQKEFGKRIGVSWKLVQGIESGARKLSDEVAEQIEMVTGACGERLRAGELVTLGGDNYSRAYFDRWMSEPVSPRERKALGDETGHLLAALIEASHENTDSYRRLVTRLSRFLRDSAAEVGIKKVNAFLAARPDTWGPYSMTVAEMDEKASEFWSPTERLAAASFYSLWRMIIIKHGGTWRRTANVRLTGTSVRVLDDSGGCRFAPGSFDAGIARRLSLEVVKGRETYRREILLRCGEARLVPSSR